MKPTGIEMAWVTVKDFNAAIDFFTNTLGLTLNMSSPEHNWAEFSSPSGAHVGICQEDTSTECPSPIKAGGNAVICFTVADIEATKAELVEKGVELVGDIQEVPGHVKLLLIRDNSGNFYHIVQDLTK